MADFLHAPDSILVECDNFRVRALTAPAVELLEPLHGGHVAVTRLLGNVQFVYKIDGTW